jgi:hypothetical protein
MADPANEDAYSEEETERRMRAGLMKALHTPAKPHQPSKAKGKESQRK